VRKIETPLPRPFCMQIITPNRIFYVAAEDNVSLDEWVRVMMSVSSSSALLRQNSGFLDGDSETEE